MSRQPATVLALAASAYGGYGGIAQATQDFLSALNRLEYVGEIHILPRQGFSSNETVSSLKQYDAVPGRLEYALTALSLAHHKRPKMVYCGHLYMVPLAALISKLYGSQLVAHLHGLEVWPEPSRLQAFALASSDLILCVSNDTRQRACEHVKSLQDKCAVIYNTVGKNFLPGNKAEARRKFDLGEEKILLTVSRLDTRQRHKGHEKVIAALPNLRACGHNVRYIIAGDGDDQSRLRALADEIGVAGNVTFLGRVPAEELPLLYRAADLYIMPSTREGFGIAFVEAMASGTTALGLALGGATDALCHGRLGLAVKDSELVGTILQFLDGQKPDPFALSKATHDRFGQAAFDARVRFAIESILK